MPKKHLSYFHELFVFCSSNIKHGFEKQTLKSDKFVSDCHSETAEREIFLEFLTQTE